MNQLTRRAVCSGIMLTPLLGCSSEKSVPPPKAANTIMETVKPTSGLIELVKMDPAIRLDIRYATPNNFTGKTLYKQPRAFLQAAAADALLIALRQVKAQGFGLTVFDGYRPLAITQYMWDVTPPAKRDYVANPKRGSRHNRGCAVDLTLHDLKTGRQVEMPSPYDDFSTRAHQDFMDAPPATIANRATLRDAMMAAGFLAASNEWWHFDFKDWENYPIMDVPFESL
jgi:zinc D-Ala-D-Ala dipeptidase